MLQQCRVNQGGFLSGVHSLHGQFFSLSGLPGRQRGSQSSGEGDSAAMQLTMSGYNVPNPGYGGHFGESIKVRREGGSK